MRKNVNEEPAKIVFIPIGGGWWDEWKMSKTQKYKETILLLDIGEKD